MAFINASFTPKGGVSMVWVDAEEYHNQPSPNGMEIYDTLSYVDGMKLAVDIADSLRYTFFRTKREDLVKQINEQLAHCSGKLFR